MHATIRSRRASLFFFLALVFLFRFWFGTSSTLWLADEAQIYLIGLKFYTTHLWPFWGPDAIVPPSGVVSVQVAGALQGLMAGLPFFVKPVPEAPHIFVNLLSLASLSLLAWYCTRRLPEIPGWIAWCWLMTAPWSIEISTRVYNPAYALAGSIVFFVGFLELLPYTRQRSSAASWITPNRAAFLMGLGLCWVMQFHASWIALAPLALGAFYFQKREKESIGGTTAGFALGCLVTGAFVLPTYVKFGLLGGTGGAMRTMTLNTLGHPRRLPGMVANIVVRFLSFASFALPTFLRDEIHERWAFFHGRPWLLPFFFFPIAVGLLQPAALIVLWFRKQEGHKDWAAIKYVTLACVAILCGLFLFSSVEPTAHTFYVMFPLAMIYSLYCWSAYLRRRGWQIFAGIFLLCGIVVHVAMGMQMRPYSFLSEQRERARMALQQKDYRILWERRAGTRY